MRVSRPAALVWSLMSLCLVVLVMALAVPLTVGAKEPVGSGAVPDKPSPLGSAPGSMPRDSYSDAGRESASAVPSGPNMEGGPDAFGYTFADDRDIGGPVYNFREATTRVGDDEWRKGDLDYDPNDDGVVTKTLPFPFTFYGGTYNDVRISTNGNIHFGEANTWVPVREDGRECVPSTSPYAPKAMIAPLWYDFVVPLVSTDTVGGVYYRTEGTTPNRSFIVEWRNVTAFTDRTVSATFELILSENGDIHFYYKTLNPGNSGGVYGSQGVVGIQNATGSVGLPYLCYADLLLPNRAIRYQLIRDVFLRPSTAIKGGAPGATVTFTETLFNQTGIDNSFVLTYSGNLWPTTVEPDVTGTIPRSGSTVVTVRVNVPPGTAIGAKDDVLISASSTLQTPGQYTATAVLTTSVTTTGVDFTPDNLSRGGDYDSPVVYQLRLFNRSGQTNRFNVQKEQAPQQLQAGWSSSLTPSDTGNMAPDASIPLTLTVNVPEGARLGDSDVLTISASSQLVPGYFGAEVVTTTAGLWKLRADLDQARSRASAVSFGTQGHIYVLGGETGNGETGLPIELYDGLGNMWHTRAMLPQSVANAGAGVIGNAIYVVGGTTGADAQQTLQVYYPENNTAMLVTSDPLPAPRFGAGVAAVNGKLYVVGGAASNQIGTNTVFEFDPNRPVGSRWQSKAAMSTARMYLGVASVDGIIYAVGGTSRAVPVNDLNVVEAYNPATDSWTTLSPMSRGRAGVALVGVNTDEPGCGGRLYALGGGYMSPTNTAEVYDPSTGEWRAISKMGLSRRTHAAAYNAVTRSLVVAGGWSNGLESAVESISCVAQGSICQAGFTDVAPDSPFYPYIRCLACKSVIGGYADGTFGPNNPVTRGQLSKIVSNAAGFNEEQTGQTYEDVPPGSTFHLFIERLSSRGVMAGYPCGGTNEPCISPQNRPYFRPNTNTSRGQITKIVANAAGFNETVPSGRQTFTDVPPGSTFYEFVERLTLRNVMGGYTCGNPEPCDPQNRPYFRTDANASRGQISKIVANTFFPDCEATIRPDME